MKGKWVPIVALVSAVCCPHAAAESNSVVIRTRPEGQSLNHDVSGNIVVWGDYRNGNNDIVV